MAHSSTTTNFNLPQFAGTDHPSFTGDFNEAFKNLDNFLKDIRTIAEQAQTAADSATEAASAATTAAGAATTAAGTAQSAAEAAQSSAEEANGLAATAQSAAENAQTRADEAYALAEQGGGGVSLEDVFPVGSIYMNYNVTTNPATLLGFGTWQRISGYYLMADSGTPGRVGGENGFYITEDQMPSHSHDVQPSNEVLGTSGGSVARKNAASGSGVKNVITSENAFSYTNFYATTRAGGGQKVYYNPEFIALCVWRRTA